MNERIGRDGRRAGRLGAGRRRGVRRLALVGVLGLNALAAACGAPPADVGRKDSAGSAEPGAAGTPQPGGAAARPAAGGAVRVVFVGTSLTAGLGLDPDSAYPALLQRKADSAGMPVAVVNAGVSGETSAGALRRIDWVLREPVDVLVLETGANDGLRALRVDSTRANLEAILRRVRGAHPQARLVLVQMEAPPNLGAAYTASFRAMYPDVAQATGATLTPFLLDRVAGVAGLNQPDGVHPNERGARLVAETVWGALRPVLDSARAAR